MSAREWHASSTMRGRAFDIGAADGSNVALVFGPEEGGPDDLPATASLIAAAPDLLEALKGVVYAFGANSAEPHDLYRALLNRMGDASAAIARAEGRT